ncbi:hypothetical protein [Streptomyces lancefieldiae]|uniref:Uncharacterized protein n=1 Tax=Streptomyces lancefieldiae TaxID=3075520 RepID=A0ABU3APN8_9ACTN|nr:hypothetical protein [Streptomyces sp. DSM 40712]MDT0612142.1 hypothetical protein [Streptomyces sp. DSM 40712]
MAGVQVLGVGRFPGSHRHADTAVGARLRSTGHTRSTAADSGAVLRLSPHGPVSGLSATSVFRATAEGAAVRVRTYTEATGERLTVQAVASA